MNKVLLLGRLTADPEVRYSQSAEPLAVVRYSLAVQKRFRREGEPDADFINCVAFGKTGEFAEKYFKKGQMVGICGRIQTRSWDDQQTGQKRYSTEVVIEDQYFAESKASFENRSNQGFDQNQGYASGPPNSNISNEPSGFSVIAENVDDDDLPF